MSKMCAKKAKIFFDDFNFNEYSWGFYAIFKNLQLLPTDEKRPADLKLFLFSFPRIEDVMKLFCFSHFTGSFYPLAAFSSVGQFVF